MNLNLNLFQPFNDDYNNELDKSVVRIDYVTNSTLQNNFNQKKLQLAFKGTKNCSDPITELGVQWSNSAGPGHQILDH